LTAQPQAGEPEKPRMFRFPGEEGGGQNVGWVFQQTTGAAGAVRPATGTAATGRGVQADHRSKHSGKDGRGRHRGREGSRRRLRPRAARPSSTEIRGPTYVVVNRTAPPNIRGAWRRTAGGRAMIRPIMLPRSAPPRRGLPPGAASPHPGERRPPTGRRRRATRSPTLATWTIGWGTESIANNTTVSREGLLDRAAVAGTRALAAWRRPAGSRSACRWLTRLQDPVRQAPHRLDRGGGRHRGPRGVADAEKPGWRPGTTTLLAGPKPPSFLRRAPVVWPWGAVPARHSRLGPPASAPASP